MKCKKIRSKDVFRSQVVDSANTLADIVGATLGPDGLPILIEIEGIKPISTKDGVTVAEHVNVKGDNNVIIQSMKEASKKTNEEAGDGTTTAIVLMRAIIQEGMKYINTGVITPQRLVAEIRQVEPVFYDMLDKMALPVRTKDDQCNVATISANGDRLIAEKIVEALDLAGEHGYISLEDGVERDTVVKFVEGYSMPVGWSKLGPHGLSFVTHPERGVVELTKPAILFYDGVLSDMNDIAHFYRVLTNDGINPLPLLIMAYSFEGDAFEFLRINRMRLGFNIGLIQCPIHGTANARRYILDDLAMFTGGKVIGHDSFAISNTLAQNSLNGGLELKSGWLGSCAKVVIGKRDSVIFSGAGDPEQIEHYMKSLQQQLQDAESEYEKDLIKTRIAKMVGGIVEIGVGGATELEMKERKYRVEDALSATRAAIELGIVPGGGSALFLISTQLESLQESIGQKVLRTAVRAPLYQILRNADLSADVIAEKILSSNKEFPACGYDVRTKTFQMNMVDAGIIDPVKVTKLALQNAISIACELLCGGGMIVLDHSKDLFEKMSPEDYRPDLYTNENNQQY